MSVIQVSLPLKQEQLVQLRAGDRVELTVTLFTGRDAAHKRMFKTIEKGEDLPFHIQGQTI